MEQIEVLSQKIPPEYVPYVNQMLRIVATQTLKMASKKTLKYIDPEFRNNAIDAIGEVAVDIASTIGSIFTASATKEIFGWADRFNVSTRVSRIEPIRSLLERAASEKSGIDISDISKLSQKYYDWPEYDGPWSYRGTYSQEGPVLIVNLDDLKTIMNTSTYNISTDDEPEGQLTEEQWQSILREKPNLKAIMNSELPLHIGYQFQLGPQAAVHHGIYFGSKSGPDGGLVIEVLNRLYDNKENVKSFIAPSTLLHFMYRAASNGVNGLLVYRYEYIIPMSIAFSRARFALGSFNYNVLKHNCENFVSWVLMNIDSNSTCAKFKSAVVKAVKDQLDLNGGKKKVARTAKHK